MIFGYLSADLFLGLFNDLLASFKESFAGRLRIAEFAVSHPFAQGLNIPSLLHDLAPLSRRFRATLAQSLGKFVG